MTGRTSAGHMSAQEREELEKKLDWHTKSKNPLRKYRRQELINYCHGKIVLDIGGGMGRFAEELRKKSFTVTVVDIDRQLLEYGASRHKHVRFVHGDALRLPFKDNTFDEVVMEQIIEHIPEQRRAVAEAHRVLRKGGRLIISTPNKYVYRVFIFIGKLVYGRFRELFSHVPGHIAELRPDQFRKLLSPFSKVTIEGLNPFCKGLAKKVPILGIGLLAVARK